MNYITKKDIALPKRRSNSRKGENGEVLVVGGSSDYVGCLVLAGLAALRSGVDWVTIAAPEKVGWAVSSLSADLVVKKFKGKMFAKEHAKKVIGLSKIFDCVLIGNGIGVADSTKQFVKKVVEINGLKVIDADGVKAVGIDDFDNAIITPHRKEMELFLKNSGFGKKTVDSVVKENDVKKKALLIKKLLGKRIKNNIIVVTGPVDIIISKHRLLFNKTGNAGMTRGGTGDVLAGLAAGFLAQSRDLLQSAVNAVYLNGVIGDILLKKKKGFFYIASDMVEEIERVLKQQNI